MLHKPDAAYLTQAGRGYLQVGNDEIYEQFQSGWSGASYDDETGSAKQVIAKLLTSTGRAGLVGNHMKTKRMEGAKLKWFTALYEAVSGAENEDVAEYYRLLAQTGIDYAVNEHNSRLLRNFAELYYEACSACGDGKKPEDICRYIMGVSESRKVKVPDERKNSAGSSRRVSGEGDRGSGLWETAALMASGAAEVAPPEQPGRIRGPNLWGRTVAGSGGPLGIEGYGGLVG